ncbi:uncharacterized protein MICPUCDRAFT_12795, partial [Micromonas pusilla CCMP1545]
TEEILDGIMSRFDVDGAGYVDLPKFCNFLMSRSKGGPAELRKAFTHFDKDRSGFITKTQLAEALHDFQMALSPAELDALIARYDSTGTGQISKADFV